MSESDSSRGRSALQRGADALVNASVLERIGIAAGATVFALFVGLLIVTAAGYDPLVFVRDVLVGAFGSSGAVTRTLRFTTIFVLAGVAVAVAFKAGVFNIGVQGQLIVGGISCVMAILWLAPYFPENSIGGFVLVLVGFVASLIGGGLYGALPGALKAYADANEIITTIMLNFIAVGAVGWAVQGPFRDTDARQVRTERLPDHVGFPELTTLDSGTFSILGLGIAILTAVAVAILLTRTRVGYDMVTSGYQEAAATYSGVDAERTIVATMTLSGMIAGLTGAIFAIMVQGYFGDPGGIGSYGFDAIAVSLLAANNPIGVVPAALLFGGLNSAGQHVQIASDVPIQLIDGIVGLVVLFVAAPELFRMLAKRRGSGGETR